MATTPISDSETPKTQQQMADDDRKWCDLPRDILIHILKFMVLPADLINLRSVCQPWRSNLSLEEYQPAIATLCRGLPIPPSSHLLPSQFHFLSPLSDDGTALGGRWLTRMGFMGINKRHIFNPFNILDYLMPSPAITGSMNLLDCRPPLQLATVYTLVDNIRSKNCKAISKKVVGGWNLKSDYLFSVLYQLERGDGLFLWKLGDPDVTEIEGSLRILDIVSHNEKFFAFELLTWRIGVIDPATAEMEFLSAPDILGEEIDGMFSVSFDGVSYILGNVNFVSASNGCLYLVFGLTCLPKKKRSTMIVFVMKEEEDGKIRWENVKSLEDQIFFIGYDAAFSLPSSSINLPQWKPNSICCFLRPFPLIFDGCMNGYGMKMPEGVKCLKGIDFAAYYRYISIFSMDEEKKGVVSFQKLSRETYTGLFFPPPAWVKWQCPSLDNAEVKLHELKFTDARKMFGDRDSSDDDDDVDDDDDAANDHAAANDDDDAAIDNAAAIDDE